MARTCTVCGHPDRYDIEELLATRQASYRDIAGRYALSKTAVSRHAKEGHVGGLLALAADAERAARADSLLDRIEALQARTEAALARAEAGDDPAHVFRGIGEMRRNLELIGEVTKELNRSPTLNLQFNQQWVQVREAVVMALAPYPDASRAVGDALASFASTNGKELPR